MTFSLRETVLSLYFRESIWALISPALRTLNDSGVAAVAMWLVWLAWNPTITDLRQKLLPTAF
jgi:hypothetical protein